MSYNIIGDIGGQFDAFMKLIEKMPKGEIICVGDLVDRGPKSKEVVEWVMKNGKSILGNHEHMMIDAYRKGGYYQTRCWGSNGGNKTIQSFGACVSEVPEEIIKWMENNPKYMIIGDIFISHSFITPGCKLEDVLDVGQSWMDYKCDQSIIWNRDKPERRPEYKLQVAGHNSQFKLRRFADEHGEYAICLDDSGNGKLTGLHIPSMEIFQQEF